MKCYFHLISAQNMQQYARKQKDKNEELHIYNKQLNELQLFIRLGFLGKEFGFLYTPYSFLAPRM